MSGLQETLGGVTNSKACRDDIGTQTTEVLSKGLNICNHGAALSLKSSTLGLYKQGGFYRQKHRNKNTDPKIGP
jgi:hypothetical protein